MSEKVFGSEKKGSLQDIPLPKSRGLNLSRGANGHYHHRSEESDMSGIPTPLGVDGHDWEEVVRRSPRIPFRLGVFIVLLLVVGVVYSFLSHSASLVVASEESRAVVTGSYEVARASQTEGGLTFSNIPTIEAVITMHVAGSQEENRQTKTQGVLQVFNTGNDEKRYVKNTRFQTPDGRVYRAFNRFVIPASSSQGPGSSEVLVVAENPGEEYNSASGLSFTLPALKEQGDPAYDEVYAQQQEPLTGGYSGIVTVPTDNDITSARQALEADLQQAVYQELSTRTGEIITSRNASQIGLVAYTEQVNESKGGIDLVGKLSLDAVAISRQDLENFLARTHTGDYDGSNVQIVNMDTLSVDFPTLGDVLDIESFELNVVGEAEFVYPVDQQALQELLSGKLVSHIENDLISGLGKVDIKEVSVSPFWRRALPKTPENISITIE